MNWLARFVRGSPPLTAAQKSQLDAYRALPQINGDALLATQRLVVVDVESTGLNLFTDRLIAIGAVDVMNTKLRLGRGFDVVLRQQAPSRVDNILVHGIGGTEQTTGADPPEALLAFLSYVDNAPLVAFHADFDCTMINRAARETLGANLNNVWLDLAQLAPALYPAEAEKCHALDDWTALFGIENLNRHNALADACATAQLLLVLLARAQTQGLTRLRDLQRLEKAQRWLGH